MIVSDLCREAIRLGVCIALAATVFSGPAHARAHTPGGDRPNAVSCTAKLDDAAIAEIDRLAEGKIRSERLPGGFTIALVCDGKIVKMSGYGFADEAHTIRMPADAVFPVASLTKTMTAFLAVKLAARGVVSLDAPIERYLPSTVRLSPSLVARPVTLETLLLHTAGWPRDPSTRRNLLLESPHGFDPTILDPDSATVGRLYTALTMDRAAGPPGVRRYSNMGYDVVGHVLERASGKSYARLLSDELTGPLGMTDTVVDRLQTMEARVPAGYSFDPTVRQLFRTPTWRSGELKGAAGVSSTAPDLARYLALLIDQTRLSAVLGGTETVDTLLRPRLEYFDGPHALFAQALGWRMSHFGQYGNVYSHTGDADSHHAFLAFSPERRVGLVVLSSNGKDAMNELGDDILLHLFQRMKQLDAPAPSPSINRGKGISQ
ncbi:serine hydrolase domain-containing protein [Tsuneonella suprasediminis]|uniref:serine hydrolase domain-containing protein n=1 Tax=Tsuneonella suprasediminis TaxID=2306996 RepID=UPI002F925C78